MHILINLAKKYRLIDQNIINKKKPGRYNRPGFFLPYGTCMIHYNYAQTQNSGKYQQISHQILKKFKINIANEFILL